MFRGKKGKNACASLTKTQKVLIKGHWSIFLLANKIFTAADRRVEAARTEFQKVETMGANPFLGVFFHWLGGLASGSFYVPYRGVKKWSWEVYWLVGGFFSWIIAPWILAVINTKELPAVILQAAQTDPKCIVWAYFWGAMWGLGGLTFGLTMRYLGMSLGMAVALGYCAAFGTLMPPIYHGEFKSKILQTNSGIVILIGIAICLLGIAIAGMAGMSKEREMEEEQKKALIEEFNFKKGIMVATFSGIFSACFAFALDAAIPIANISMEHDTAKIWSGLPKLCIVLLGGFTTNFIWCVYLNIKNKTGYQYFSPTLRRPAPSRGEEPILENPVDAPSEEMVEQIPSMKRNGGEQVPMLRNYFLTRLGRSHLVHAVLLLFDGRDADGQIRLLKLDPAHGEHHNFQLALGDCAEGMERKQRIHQVPVVAGSRHAGFLHGHRGLRQLFGHTDRSDYSDLAGIKLHFSL